MKLRSLTSSRNAFANLSRYRCKQMDALLPLTSSEASREPSRRGLATLGHSLDRLRPLWLALSIVLGAAAAMGLAALTAGSTPGDWRTFAGVVASVSATMVGFLATVAALFYALSNTAVVQHLQARGLDKRIVFDLFAGTAVWLLSLLFSLVGCAPGDSVPTREFALIAASFSVSGVLVFGPIAYSMWLVLTHAGVPAKPKANHRWEDPADLT